MPWIPTEQKEREHSKPVRDRYAWSARAHRAWLLRDARWSLLIVAVALVVAYACVLHLLIK